MYIQTIYQFKKTLTNLDQCLAKAVTQSEAKKYDVNILVDYRLAPDMFPLKKQVQSACDAAKFCAAYLSGQTAPKHEDTETTWPQLRERIQKVVTYLEGFKDQDFADAHSAKVSPGWAKGKWLPSEDYLFEVATPNFYFHVMATYAILRHACVDIGKMDYLGTVNMRDAQ